MIALHLALVLAVAALAWGFVSLAWRGRLFTSSSRIAPGAAHAAGDVGECPGGHRSPFLGRAPNRGNTGRAGRPSFGRPA